MIQCVSDSNPYDDEPDVIEEAESWLSLHTALYGQDSEEEWAKFVIEGLLGYIKDEI